MYEWVYFENTVNSQWIRLINTQFHFQNEFPFRLEDWKNAFREMDSDNSGQLSVDEIFQGLKRSGCHMPIENVREIVASVDDDGNQSISIDEFITLMRL